MNKLFLQQLQERRSTFHLIDLSVEDKKHNEEEESEREEECEDSDSEEKDFEPVKTRFKNDELTKYLQYVTASD